MSNPTAGNRIPEHTARAMDGDLHPELKAAYGYVDRVLHTADIQAALGIPAWYGWAIREAFLAGCSHAATLAQPEPEGVTDEELLAMRSWSCHGPTFDSDLVDFGRRCYNLGRYGTPTPETPNV
jgi:hypothetical protein